jgi:hypothetical protein
MLKFVTFLPCVVCRVLLNFGLCKAKEVIPREQSSRPRNIALGHISVYATLFIPGRWWSIALRVITRSNVAVGVEDAHFHSQEKLVLEDA